jgi:hypothetical protein
MANTITVLSYANTFGDWLVTTDALVNEFTAFSYGNYEKPTGTLFLNNPTLGLQVANAAIIQGTLTVGGVLTANAINIATGSGIITANTLSAVAANVSGVLTANTVNASTGNIVNLSSNTITTGRLNTNTLFLNGTAVGTSSLLAPTGVTPGAYGNTTSIPVISVNANGQITVAGSVPATSLNTITYDNRGSLRYTAPTLNLTTISVESLGLFTYYATGQTEPDDDESAFLVYGGPGVWLLTSPTWDLINNWQAPETEYILSCLQNLSGSGSGASCVCCTYISLSCLASRWPGSVIYTTVQQTYLSCVYPGYVLTTAYNVPCVCIGDVVVATPGTQLICGCTTCACYIAPPGYTSSCYNGIQPGVLSVQVLGANCIAIITLASCGTSSYVPCCYNLAIFKCV